jgi:subtilisin
MVNRSALACFVAVTVAVLGPIAPTASAAQPDDAGLNGHQLTVGPNADGRFIVVLRPGTDVAAATRSHRRTAGIATGRQFRNAVRGYVATLTAPQRAALLEDPSVDAVVPDELIEITQAYPTGISRTGSRLSPAARINAVDDVRVDADVAIIDTGIDATHPDLNVVGGMDCSTADPTRWRDRHGHGTHVAGTVGAIDDPLGVVGVAPGVRLWAVKILNDSGAGLLSWYVCGLDWIAGQRDPGDSSRPLIEAVNMSVAKWGRNDNACGAINDDILHAAICRVTAQGITVVAAAANDRGSAGLRVPAAYPEVITVSALADTNGRAGGGGGRRCWSWGGYDVDDTFANFSNYGAVVDLIAPGKCIWSTIPAARFAYMSGTSMAAPHVTGAAALYKATRPWATPMQVKLALQTLGSLRWFTSTDPDSRHERLLDVSRLGAWGDYDIGVGGPAHALGERGGTLRLPVTLTRSATFFEIVRFSAQVQGPLAVAFDRTWLTGFAARSTALSVIVPPSTAAGSYDVTVIGRDQAGRTRQDRITVVVENDLPTARPAGVRMVTRVTAGQTTMPVRIAWARATDATSRIVAYELQRSVDGGAWLPSGSLTGSTIATTRTLTLNHTYAYRVRARDAAGNWSAWATGSTARLGVVQDNSRLVTYRYGWARAHTASASGGTTTFGTRAGALARATVTGRQVAILAPIGRYRGVARIYVNGVWVRSVSLYARQSAARRVIWVGAWPTTAVRTIELRIVGTGGHPRVDVDAFIALR